MDDLTMAALKRAWTYGVGTSPRQTRLQSREAERLLIALSRLVRRRD
jgi:hypothetical protein